VLSLPVIYLDAAREDIDAIFMHFLKASQNNAIAEGYIRRITQCCKNIGTMPFGGRARDDLLSGLRIFPFEKKAIIAYRVTEQAVEITNIFYGGRDYEALFAHDGE
jgi:toxin ParE1/3/4